MDLKGKNVVIIAPHMDDEIIGCGGTILKFRDQMNKLVLIHMTNDDQRLKEFKKIKHQLEITKEYNLNLQDGFVGESYLNAVLMLIEIIQAEKPDVVFIPHYNDYHIDHISTNLIAIDAIEKARYWKSVYEGWKVDVIYEYEVWSFQSDVNEIVEINEFIDKKKSLMGVYESQLDFDYIKYIDCCNGYRGIFYNKCGYAECFHSRKI